eukprot:COSAG01_NODE_8204_length_2875_cov_11.768012_4_plen_310_part_00
MGVRSVFSRNTFHTVIERPPISPMLSQTYHPGRTRRLECMGNPVNSDRSAACCQNWLHRNIMGLTTLAVPSSPSWALRMDGWRSAATMEQFLSAASNVAISVSSHLDLAGARWGQRAVPLAVLGLVGVSSACCWLHCCRDMGDDCCRAFASDCQRRTEELARRPLRRSVRVLLIRHAQSETNAAAANTVVGGARHDGRGVHTRLSKLGERQARALGARLARQNLRPQAIYASDAVRTQQTAELVRAELLRGRWCGRRRCCDRGRWRDVRWYVGPAAGGGGRERAAFAGAGHRRGVHGQLEWQDQARVRE